MKFTDLEKNILPPWKILALDFVEDQIIYFIL